jgi:hypothetical protein
MNTLHSSFSYPFTPILQTYFSVTGPHAIFKNFRSHIFNIHLSFLFINRISYSYNKSVFNILSYTGQTLRVNADIRKMPSNTYIQGAIFWSRYSVVHLLETHTETLELWGNILSNCITPVSLATQYTQRADKLNLATNAEGANLHSQTYQGSPLEALATFSLLEPC